MNQHIESFDHFLDVTLDRIRKANERVRCDADSTWYLLYKVELLWQCVGLGVLSDSVPEPLGGRAEA